MSAEPTQDLNQVIASAVQARIETEVLAALSGSDMFARFVQAALHEPITVRENYRDRKTTFLAETLRTTIKEATAEAVRKVVAEEAPAIEAEVAKALRRDVKGIAKELVGSVTSAVSRPYGVKVQLDTPSGDER